MNSNIIVEYKDEYDALYVEPYVSISQEKNGRSRINGRYVSKEVFEKIYFELHQISAHDLNIHLIEAH